MECLCHYPAKPNKQNRPPLRIPACADDQLNSLAPHALYEHAIESQFDAMSQHIAMQDRPTLQERACGINVEHNATGIALVG